MGVLSNYDLGNATLDGVYTDATIVPPLPVGPATGLLAIVGGANDGPVNTPMPIGDSGALLETFGNDTVSTNAVVRGVLNAMPECAQFLINRVTDGTDTAPVIDLPNGGVFATGALTVAGTPAAGTLSATLINGSTTVTAGPVNVTTGDSVTSAAVKLANAIAASAACVGPNAFFQVPVTPTSGAINLAAAKFGTGGNSITINGTATGTGFTITPTTPTALSGGTNAGAVNVVILTRKTTGSYGNQAVAQYVLLSGSPNNSPIYALQITEPGKPTENYPGLVAYSGSGGVYSAAVLQASTLAAVNGTLPNKAGSPRWTATTGSASNPPVLSPQQASGGTDGTSGLTSALLLGTDGNAGRTGIYALRTMVTAGQVLIYGNTDPTTVQSLVTFRQQEGCIVHYSFPNGTTTLQAEATRQQYNLSDPGLVISMDWDTVFDQQSGQPMEVPPSAKIAAIISSARASQYVGNLPENGAAGVYGTVSGDSLPLTSGGQREQNGIMWLGYMPRSVRGPSLGLPHGMASDGVTRINDYRMLVVIASELQNIEGAFVGGSMNTTLAQLGQPTLGKLQDAVQAYFTGLEGNGDIVSGKFTLGAQNTPTTIGQGYLIPSVLVQTYSKAQYIINFLTVGPNPIDIQPYTPQQIPA